MNFLETLVSMLSSLNADDFELPSSLTFSSDGFDQLYGDLGGDPRYSDLAIFMGASDSFVIGVCGRLIKIVRGEE